MLKGSARVLTGLWPWGVWSGHFPRVVSQTCRTVEGGAGSVSRFLVHCSSKHCRGTANQGPSLQPVSPACPEQSGSSGYGSAFGGSIRLGHIGVTESSFNEARCRSEQMQTVRQRLGSFLKHPAPWVLLITACHYTPVAVQTGENQSVGEIGVLENCKRHK